jgi:DNA-binding transcriptional regulator YiaG
MHWKYVHRLVAEAFLGPCPEGKNVNHKDGNKFNNELSNLEYITPREQNKHAIINGLFVPVHGEKHFYSRLTELDVIWIRDMHERELLSMNKMAKALGVSSSTVAQVVKGKTWKHVA